MRVIVIAAYLTGSVGTNALVDGYIGLQLARFERSAVCMALSG
jgi:hypothetical protein